MEPMPGAISIGATRRRAPAPTLNISTYRRYGSERPSYVEFRRKPKYLKPRESFVRLSLPMIVGAVIGGLFFGALTIEQPLWGGATLGILAVAWAISAYLRGMNTGALKD